MGPGPRVWPNSETGVREAHIGVCTTVGLSGRHIEGYIPLFGMVGRHIWRFIPLLGMVGRPIREVYTTVGHGREAC